MFPAKQELLLSEITRLPLDAQMQRNRLDVDKRVEGSRQCSCSCPSWLARAARPIQVLQMQHLQGIHTYGEGSDARRTARSASATRRERWQRGCYLRKLCLFRRGVVHIYWEEPPPHHHPLANGTNRWCTPSNTNGLYNICAHQDFYTIMDQIHLSPLVDQIRLALGHISNSGQWRRAIFWARR
jgi:hypothetical protein